MRNLTVVLIALILHSPLWAQDSRLKPSEALTIMLHEMGMNPGIERSQVYDKYLPLVTTGDLNQHEQFLLGDVYFLSFKPEEARDAYYPFLEQDDLYGRVAWQRILQIRFAAFEMVDRVEKEVKTFRERFKPIPEDRLYMYWQVRNLGNHYREQNDHAKVVELIEDELTALDYSGPYSSFALPALFFSSYAAINKHDRAWAHLAKARAGLVNTLHNMEENTVSIEPEYPLPGAGSNFLYHPVIEKSAPGLQQQHFRKLIQQLDDLMQYGVQKMKVEKAQGN